MGTAAGTSSGISYSEPTVPYTQESGALPLLLATSESRDEILVMGIFRNILVHSRPEAYLCFSYCLFKGWGFASLPEPTSCRAVTSTLFEGLLH